MLFMLILLHAHAHTSAARHASAHSVSSALLRGFRAIALVDLWDLKESAFIDSGWLHVLNMTAAAVRSCVRAAAASIRRCALAVNCFAGCFHRRSEFRRRSFSSVQFSSIVLICVKDGYGLCRALSWRDQKAP